MVDTTNPLVYMYQWRNRDELNGSDKDLLFVPIKELRQYPYLRNINALDLSHNKIMLLPEDFAPVLAHLKILDLSYNSIHWFPENFGLMNLLHTLDCRSNQIQRLPGSFGDLTALVWLDLSKNPLVPTLRHACSDAIAWSPDICKKAALTVVSLIRQVKEIREREVKAGVLFGVARERTPQAQPSLPPRHQPSSAHNFDVPNTGTFSNTEESEPDSGNSESESSTSTHSAPILRRRHLLEMHDEETLIQPAAAVAESATAPREEPVVPAAPVLGADVARVRVRALPPQDENQPWFMHGLLDHPLRVVDPGAPNWKARSLAGFFATLRWMGYAFGLSVMLAFAVDQTLVDVFLEDKFSFLPAWFLTGFSYCQTSVQGITNLFSTAFPIFKEPSPEDGYFVSSYRFIVGSFSSAGMAVYNFYAQPQWL